MMHTLLRHAVVLLLIAPTLVACQPRTPPMTPEEKTVIDTLTSHMTPRCIGRYLVDMPERIRLTSLQTSKVEDVTIEVLPMAEEFFKIGLAERQTKLAKTHMDGEPDVPFLKATYPLPNNAPGIIFNRAESSGGADFGRTLELIAFANDYLIKMEINATDGSDAKYKSHPRIPGYGNDTQEKLAHLLNVFSRTRGRADNEIPTQSGLCIVHGFVSGAPSDAEEAGFIYALGSAPDVWFNFTSDSGLREEDTLLQRGSSIEAMLSASNGKTVRKGKAKGQGVAFEEWLMSGTTDAKIPGHQFSLEANATTGSATSPMLITNFHNGLRWQDEDRDNPPPALTRATFSEAQSVALWDAVTRTLRTRPGAF